VRSQCSPIPSEKIRLLVVADVRLYRENIVSSLACRDGIEVTGAASSTDEVLALVSATAPAIVVIDMATAASDDIVRLLGAQAAAVKTVAFAVGDSEQEILACVDAGVAGYVSRDASMDDLVAAIESVARGDLPVPPRIAAAMFRRLTVLRQSEREAPSLPLTARERQILLLIDEGLSNKEIAARLSIEVATVKNHVHSLLTKMHVTTRGQAAARLAAPGAARAIRTGIANPRQFIA
jgi:two-component system, NarL family, nitrate/nitrite response regulator NarL